MEEYPYRLSINLKEAKESNKKKSATTSIIKGSYGCLLQFLQTLSIN